MNNFALIGVAGYIAPRHLRAIRDTDNRLLAAVDPHDSVGILDQYSFNTRFFTEIERFDRYLEKLRHGSNENQVDWVSICSPNYLHDAHCRLALRVGANVICEKPLVINPWNLDQLEHLEDEYGRKIHTILQLRVHPQLVKLKQDIQKLNSNNKYEVVLTYITSRGSWYNASWKGDAKKSGGVVTNIGIHFFDMLLWLFGEVEKIDVHYRDENRVSGFMELGNASVKWFLSVDNNDLPKQAKINNQTTYRSITVDGQEIEFSGGFNDLHTKVYENTLSGNGFRIKDAKPSIEITHKIRTLEIKNVNGSSHPFLNQEVKNVLFYP